MFQEIVEPLLFLIVVLVGIFQIILPLSQNRKVFPMFRKDLSEAEKTLKETGQKVAVNDIEIEKEELEKKIRKPQSKTATETKSPKTKTKGK